MVALRTPQRKQIGIHFNKESQMSFIIIISLNNLLLLMLFYK